MLETVFGSLAAAFQIPIYVMMSRMLDKEHAPRLPKPGIILAWGSYILSVLWGLSQDPVDHFISWPAVPGVLLCQTMFAAGYFDINSLRRTVLAFHSGVVTIGIVIALWQFGLVHGPVPARLWSLGLVAYAAWEFFREGSTLRGYRPSLKSEWLCGFSFWSSAMYGAYGWFRGDTVLFVCQVVSAALFFMLTIVAYRSSKL